MKKTMIGLSQIVVTVLLYEILGLMGSLITNLIIEITTRLPFLSTGIFRLIIETTVYTAIPFFVAFTIAYIVISIYKKTKIYRYSFFAICVILAYTHITNLLSIIGYYGLLSWHTANTLWSSIILCGFLMFCLYKSADFKINITSN